MPLTHPGPELDLDFHRLAAELVRCIRGERSQNMLNRKLGFVSNQVSRWETGARAVAWDDFVRLCRTCRKDIDRALKRVLFLESDALQAHQILRRFMDDMPLADFAFHLGVSRHVASRWLSGKVVPETAAMLRAIAVFPRVLFEFLSQLVDPAELDSCADAFRRYVLSKGVESTHPEVGAVLRCLELDDYRSLDEHREGHVARRLGLTLEHERHLMALLQDAGIVEKRQGLFVPVNKNTDTRGDFETGRRLRLFWLDAARKHLTEMAAPRAGEAYGYLVYAVSEKVRAEVFQKYIDFYHAVRHLVTTENPNATDVMALCVQIFVPTGLGKGPSDLADDRSTVAES